jgi:hypothetical protein
MKQLSTGFLIGAVAGFGTAHLAVLIVWLDAMK